MIIRPQYLKTDELIDGKNAIYKSIDWPTSQTYAFLCSTFPRQLKCFYLGESLSASLIIRKKILKLILEELSLHDSVGFGIGVPLVSIRRLYFIPHRYIYNSSFFAKIFKIL